MEYKQIQELIKTINKSNISELSIEEGEFKITIKQDFTGHTQYVPAPVPQVPVTPIIMPQASNAGTNEKPATPALPAPVSAQTQTIKSPMIGTFYRSPSPGKPVFIVEGDEIKSGQVLCIIEAMKLFNEIESEISGKIVKILVEDSTPVEYDQPLFLVEVQ